MARNKYAGRCYCCGQWIEPGFGHFERHNGGWRIKCVKCASGRVVKGWTQEQVFEWEEYCENLRGNERIKGMLIVPGDKKKEK